MGPAPKLCRRCRRDVLPQLAQPSWHREKHRATQAEREPAESPEAAKVRRRKEGKLTRKQVRALGMIETAKIFLRIKGAKLQPPPSEECQDCLKLQRPADNARSAAA